MRLLEISNGIKAYLVGGAVRDRLLGRPVKDRDWVVVGATPQEMLNRGYKKVGADFPVFLHPETGEEYALARQERKVGKGYHGFETTYDPSVSLEDDLARRDLTINAIAYDPKSQEIIDPFNGQRDLKQKIIRHTSEAFAEDPVRLLRVARFRARYGFSIAPETMKLLKKMVNTGEIDHLVAERVYIEMEKAIGEEKPSEFFNTLKESGALDRLFPELKYSSEVAKALDKAAAGGASKPERFAILFYETPPVAAQNVLQRFKSTNVVSGIVGAFKTVYDWLKATQKPSGKDAIQIIEQVGGFKGNILSVVNHALKFVGKDISKIVDIARSTKGISFKQLPIEQQQTLKGPQIGNAIRELRVSEANRILRGG